MDEIFSISVVTENDIPAVTQVVNSAYQGEPGSRSWTSESHLVAGQRTTENILRDLIAQPPVTMLKYTNEQGEVLGCVLLEQKDGTLYLGMLSVSPQAQALGIGSKLLQQGEAFAREHQYHSVTITVINLRHELIDWYRRKGFVPTGKLEPFSNKSSAARADFSFMEMKKELL
ncbi:GNAT family N-acetyltransferase [Pseudoflavitalea sp. X16]|uniref:GNAT family N-acetyltransferase n=1 Tax=Paraflavitalea devenefica TaxID=2716334 RepID=UPI0014230B7F|nr:GNAT family N-acetyltransferase [Paraflavitalea devenefica]NII25899.1 GNAT family N-acetyltransferase [Paraflavitalea devenefica]